MDTMLVIVRWPLVRPFPAARFPAVCRFMSPFVSIRVSLYIPFSLNILVRRSDHGGRPSGRCLDPLGPHPVVLLDLAGGLAQRLDLPPACEPWTDLADLVDQHDAALAEALSQPSPDLWALPLTGLVDSGQAEQAPDPALVRAVVAAGRRVWQVVVVDLPRRPARRWTPRWKWRTCCWR
jgi:hypothetical protein